MSAARESQTSVTPKRSLWVSRLFLLSLGGAALLVVGALVIGVQQYRAEQQFQRELGRIEQAGQPIGNESLATWFKQHSHSEGTVAWQQILTLAEQSTANFPDFDRLPVQGGGELPTLVEPDVPWEAEEVVADYLDYVQPVLEQIEAAESHPRPVWQPLAFKGYGTLLPEVQAARSLVRILQLEVELALYRQDAERAMRGIRGMRVVREAFSLPGFMVIDLVAIALEGVRLGTIERSLHCDIWSAEQLKQLQQEVGPPQPVAQRWRRAIYGERATFLTLTSAEPSEVESLIGGSHVPGAVSALKLPTVKRDTLAVYRKLIEIGDDDLDELHRRAQAFERRYAEATSFSPSAIVANLLIPAASSFANAHRRIEDQRRFVRTAIAIKQFQQREGEWPSGLSELTDVGLTTADWTIVDGPPFGYQSTEDEAYLWGYDLGTDYRATFTIPDQRPDPAIEQDDHNDRLHIWSATIR